MTIRAMRAAIGDLEVEIRSRHRWRVERAVFAMRFVDGMDSASRGRQ
jgi:hypothetical protein